MAWPRAALPFERKEDVVYGRKFGTALTMTYSLPRRRPTAAGLIFVVSGGWFSGHEAINAGLVAPFLSRGYTVFAVVHGSQPKFTIPEVVADMRRSVRFVRTHAKEYGSTRTPGYLRRLGRRHLSLMMGTTSDAGKAGDPRPVERASSRVQAVACFFPPPTSSITARAARSPSAAAFSKPFKRHSTSRSSTGSDAYSSDRRRGRTSQDRPGDLAGVPHLAGRPPDADHPRRRRQARADPASRADRGEAAAGSRPRQARRQAGRGPRLGQPRERITPFSPTGSTSISSRRKRRPKRPERLGR